MSRPHMIDEAGWERFAAAHSIGDVLRGEVVSVLPFGAFVRVDEGIDGLAPIVQWPALPAAGTVLAVRIVAIDAERRRVAFGPAA
jgi:ribosomal protein S1